ncbi:2,5-dioxovalerate dehydrogenase [Sphingomonas melonis TY]|jgi:2,5-dioxopentanoate dehydrogenase|uniref:2,5-dioxovalerate dehydrogenase n=2 Tax=Pseudomonadota TaxID=1224 RepID=A0A175Y2A0_9SPHN|nr:MULTISPECIES: aldehyde dehydrogenase (NADP(+)) [Sphingomonas]AOW22996.1 aldehyde dehydrogenase (NADP(+)) [Sphingomonas melonis TY]ATI56414.1 aldehyde dehydrogenase (NADP(+)) [Sphingomonas melonis]KZB94486.1 2,5-dioxovalerate dehydrogenase [Sphingomonas melonis TY]MBI0529918.1 aldehyde dehydrogenase (NADP(+)) [Sphingomonas sp. TX0522]MBX8846861.1 aldehyde dehydrogenase (NADP(+)) [Sphingomonas melonis]
MIDGALLIGGDTRQAETRFTAVNPATGETLTPDFSSAGADAVAEACALADAAFPAFAATDPETRAAFLERIADNIVGLGDDLIVRAMAESGLPRMRLEGERGRTVGQLKLFAGVVRQGDFLDATIDPAMPDRAPLPRPDLRRVNVAIGPVAVFGASNFPLAFSVAGGDTASALAAGCPVVVKGHPAHPGTGELVARAIAQAVKDSGLPAGVFSYLPGETNELGAALVRDPRIQAVGFTGSRGGGLALVRIAAEREEPIPVYAEMSSINPVVLFPAALAARGEAMGKEFVASLTMGAGQFCTNPGLVLAIDGPDLDAFIASAATAMTDAAPATMLTPGIHASFEQGVDALAGHDAVKTVARGKVGDGVNQAVGAIFDTTAEAFLADRALSHEVFGSSSVVVRCRDMAEIARVIAGLEGQLTATLQMDAADEADAARLVPVIARRVGRILANGWPTGVEVAPAMVHGGPFPATSDGRTTSVGTLAIARYLRPVCFQNLAPALLPAALDDANPWGIARRLDGKREASPR